MADPTLLDLLPLAPVALLAILFATVLARRTADPDSPRRHFERAAASGQMRAPREKPDAA